LLPLLAVIPATPTGDSVAQLIAPAPLSVRPTWTKLRIREAKLNVLEGSTATVTGVLHAVPVAHTAEPQRPALAGRTVALQRHDRHGWRTILRAPTRARGGFVF
jgi:hypothetical protein